MSKQVVNDDFQLLNEFSTAFNSTNDVKPELNKKVLAMLKRNGTKIAEHTTYKNNDKHIYSWYTADTFDIIVTDNSVAYINIRNFKKISELYQVSRLYLEFITNNLNVLFKK